MAAAAEMTNTMLSLPLTCVCDDAVDGGAG